MIRRFEYFSCASYSCMLSHELLRWSASCMVASTLLRTAWMLTQYTIRLRPAMPIARSSWAANFGGSKMSFDPLAIRIRRGRPYADAHCCSASTAPEVGRLDQLFTAIWLPSRPSSRVASDLPSWTEMLSPNMYTPSVSRTRCICVVVEMARVPFAQEPSTPEPYGPVAVAAVAEVDAVVADAVSVETATVTAAAAPTVKICRRLGF